MKQINLEKHTSNTPGRLRHDCHDSSSPSVQRWKWTYTIRLDTPHHPVTSHPLSKSLPIKYCSRSLYSLTYCPSSQESQTFEKNHNRPVALTPLAMKCLEKENVEEPSSLCTATPWPPSVARRSKAGAEDAAATLLHKLLKHPNKPGHHARIGFVDFSSGFNTTQRHAMTDKLQQLEVPALTIRRTDKLQQLEVPALTAAHASGLRTTL